MKKIFLIPIIFALTTLSANAELGVKIFDIPVQKGALKEFQKPIAERHNVPTSVNYAKVVEKTEPDITIADVNGIYVIKIKPEKLNGEIKPYYVTNLKTNEEVFEETNARLVVNAGFFDPKNHQTVSYLTLNGKVILDPHNNKNLIENKHLTPYLDKILNRSEFRILKSETTGTFKYDIAPHNEAAPSGYKILHAIQGGPGLVPDLRLDEEFFVLTDKSGKIVSQSASSLSKYARTLIAIKNNEVYLIIATTAHPMTLPEASDMLNKAGFEKGMAFDGGGSVSLDFRDKNLHVISDKNQTARKLKSFLIITDNSIQTKNQQVKPTEYRIQSNSSSPEVKVEAVEQNGIPVPTTKTSSPIVELSPTK